MIDFSFVKSHRRLNHLSRASTCFTWLTPADDLSAPGTVTNYQRFIIATALATYLLIVVGAVVRVTGSGLGCPDWPLCHGRLLPPLEMTAILEYSHRTIAALASLLILSVMAWTWLFKREDRRLSLPAAIVPLLLIVQIGLGAITVLLELPPSIVLVHLVFAMTILGLLVWMSVAAGPPVPVTDILPALRRFSRLGYPALGLSFLLVVTGAYVRASGATWACAGFPLCNGELAPFGQPLVDIHLLHRLTAILVGAHLLATAAIAWQLRHAVPEFRSASIALAASVVLQLLVGIAAVSMQVPTVLRGLHVAGAAAVWAMTVLLVALYVTRMRGAGAAAEAVAVAKTETPAEQPRLRVGDLALAYLRLTKPSIISLLLITTLAAMLVAAQGMPPLLLVVATLLGGALSAGAANTFNCYIDRDIDQLMGRTSLRPIPSGAISPRHALVFGVVLTVLSTAMLGFFANWLAATLAFIGLLYYVFVYTCWLKRSTPSNIVIGGAAGAVPPLVGWAAVTGEVGLLAVYLFAVIFFWTPPHFWALALLIRREYEKARIPMLPIVRGEAETRQQILIYSLWLVVFTLSVVIFQEVGVFYLTAAVLLGGLFIYHATRLLREATLSAARGLFRFSILYLALLFAALVVDRWKFV